MDDALGVRLLDGSRDLSPKRHHVFDGQRPAKWRPLDKLHHQVIGTDVMQLTDVRMIEGGNGARFLLEAGDVLPRAGA